MRDREHRDRRVAHAPGAHGTEDGRGGASPSAGAHDEEVRVGRRVEEDACRVGPLAQVDVDVQHPRCVTDLRRRDRELVTKDATIREIHHRVKNNLQTVAALLRLQARRMDSPDAKSALEEAVRRVGSIALVHETLSQTVEENVDFDEVADRLGTMVTDVGSSETSSGRGYAARGRSG